MTTATTFTTSNSMKKLSCSGQMIILKVTMFLILLFCMPNILFIVADMKMKKIKPQLCVFRKELKKRYEIEAHNQKLKLTLPDFLSNWAYCKPIVMLE